MSEVSETVIVVGAGIFGVTAAVELNRRGHAVTLIDPGPLPHPDASSTDISKLIRMDYGADELYVAMMEEAFQGWDRWNEEWKEPLYHQTGITFATHASPFPENSYEANSFNTLTKRGYALERLDSTSLKERFPAWNTEHYRNGYYNPQAGWAESSKVISKLVLIAQEEGVTLIEGKALDHFLQNGSRVTGIATDDGAQYTADIVVLATGAWTPRFLPELEGSMWTSGHPVMHFLPDNPADFQPPNFTVWAADLPLTGWYGFVSKPDDGVFKVGRHGVGLRISADQPRVFPEDLEADFREFLRLTFPELANAPMVGNRICLYCDTWDGDFWIDHDPNRPGLVIATGGNGHGFKFAPALGNLIADVVEQKPNPYKSRFAWRDRGSVTREEARSEQEYL